MSERESLFSLNELREFARLQMADEAAGGATYCAVRPQVLKALVEAVSAAQRRILGEYAPGVSMPSSADYEALRVACRLFEFDRMGE